MSKLHKIYLAIVGVLVIGVLYAAHAYTMATAKADAQQSATNQVIAATDRALADRDKSFEAYKSQVQQQIAAMTARQAVTVLQPVVSQAGQIAPQQVTKADLPPDVQKTLSGAPDTHFTLFNDDQMVLLGQREKSCQLTEAGLSKCDQDKADYLAQIAALKKVNDDWQKAGGVGKWTALLGATKDAAGKGYSPTLLLDYRFTRNVGLFGGVQGHGDLTAGVSIHFGGPK